MTNQELQDALNDARAAKTAAEAQVTNLTDRLAEANRLKDEAEVAKQVAENEATALEADKQTAEGQLVAANRNLAAANTAKTAAEADVTRLNTELANANTAKTAAEADVTRLNTELANANTAKTAAEADVTRLNTELATAQAEVTRITGLLTAATTDLATRTTERDTARQERDTARNDLTTRTTELTEANRLKGEAETAKTTAENERDDAKKTLKWTRIVAAAAGVAILALILGNWLVSGGKKATDPATTTSVMTKTDEAEVARLKTELTEAGKKLAAADARATVLTNQVSTLTAERNAGRAMVEQTSKTIDNQQQTIKDLLAANERAATAAEGMKEWAGKAMDVAREVFTARFKLDGDAVKQAFQLALTQAGPAPDIRGIKFGVSTDYESKTPTGSGKKTIFDSGSDTERKPAKPEAPRSDSKPDDELATLPPITRDLVAGIDREIQRVEKDLEMCYFKLKEALGRKSSRITDAVLTQINKDIRANERRIEDLKARRAKVIAEAK